MTAPANLYIMLVEHNIFQLKNLPQVVFGSTEATSDVRDHMHGI